MNTVVRGVKKLNLWKMLAIVCVFGIIVGGITSCSLIQSANATIVDLTAKMDDLNNDIFVSEQIVLEQRKTNDQLKDMMDELSMQQQELDNSNKKLLKQNKEYYSQLKKLTSRKELFDKYEYAIIYGGKRTDLTYAQLKTGESLMKEKGYDPNLLFGMIMTESRGVETAKNTSSTARGYGQFLSGTAQYVYHDLLKRSGSYNHEVDALDGDLNIQMTAAYIDYLMRHKQYDVYAVINSYSGRNSSEAIPYIRSIDSFIAKSGTSVSKIARQK